MADKLVHKLNPPSVSLSAHRHFSRVLRARGERRRGSALFCGVVEHDSIACQSEREALSSTFCSFVLYLHGIICTLRALSLSLLFQEVVAQRLLRVPLTARTVVLVVSLHALSRVEQAALHCRRVRALLADSIPRLERGEQGDTCDKLVAITAYKLP